MERSDRKRTTLTPGMVDLPKRRKTSAEVALEKKKKNDAATAKARAKRLAAVQVAELESQMVTAQDKGSSVNALVPKQSRKRPATGASRDVSFSDHRSDKLLTQVARPRPQQLNWREPRLTDVERRGRLTNYQQPRQQKRKGGQGTYLNSVTFNFTLLTMCAQILRPHEAEGL